MATLATRDLVRDRVEILMWLEDGRYLLEELGDTRWPENLGRRRCPGGKIEPGETAAESLFRELSEEYGIQLQARLDVPEIYHGPRGRVVRFEAIGETAWIGLVSSSGQERLVAMSGGCPQPWF